MIRISRFTLLFVLVVATARAEPYWVAYEGSGFPENEGWIRASSDPPAERWLEDGSLFIDSRAELDSFESYGIPSNGGQNPEPGETFVVRWGLEVQEVTPWEDPGVAITSDDQYAVTFVFAEGYVTSTYEPNASAEFAPGMFHEFEMRSADMRSYELYIDGALAIEGVLHESFFPAGVGFGDLVRGGSSLARWDYFHFGVVPEPACGSLLLLALAARGILT